MRCAHNEARFGPELLELSWHAVILIVHMKHLIYVISGLLLLCELFFAFIKFYFTNKGIPVNDLENSTAGVGE